MDYMIDSSNLNKVEGTKKSDFTDLTNRVSQAENALSGLASTVETLGNNVWALAGTMTDYQLESLDVPINGKQEIFVRIDTGKASIQGEYNIGYYLPVIALNGTSAQSRLTLTNVQGTAAKNITIDVFIYSPNVARFNTILLNGGSLDTHCTVYVYTK